MAAPHATHRRRDPLPDEPARTVACRHDPDPGHREPCQRSTERQEGAEHDNGAAPARALWRAGRCAAAAGEDGDEGQGKAEGGVRA